MGTTTESVIRKRNNGLGNPDLCQYGTRFKNMTVIITAACSIGQTGSPFGGKGHGLQGSALIKGTVTQTQNAIRDLHPFQSSTACKGIAVNAHQGHGHGQRVQRRTLIECMVFDLLKGIGQIQLFQRRAAVESAAADHGQLIIKSHIRQVGAAVESTAADGCKFRRQNDSFQRGVAGKSTDINGLNDITIHAFRDHDLRIIAQITVNRNACSIQHGITEILSRRNRHFGIKGLGTGHGLDGHRCTGGLTDQTFQREAVIGAVESKMILISLHRRRGAPIAVCIGIAQSDDLFVAVVIETNTYIGDTLAAIVYHFTGQCGIKFGIQKLHRRVFAPAGGQQVQCGFFIQRLLIGIILRLFRLCFSRKGFRFFFLLVSQKHFPLIGQKHFFPGGNQLQQSGRSVGFCLIDGRNRKSLQQQEKRQRCSANARNDLRTVHNVPPCVMLH